MLAIAAMALVGGVAVGETTAPEHATTATTQIETGTTASETSGEVPTTVPARNIVRIPEGMEQRWTRLEAAGRAAGLTEDELTLLRDLESKLFLARLASDADAERRAVAERRALLTPARWRVLRDELRRQAIPDATVGGAGTETTAPVTETAEIITTGS